MSKETALLKSMFSFTKTPLICSAPMLGTTGPDLITAVYKSGGLGFLGAGFDLTNLSANLAHTHSLLPDITPLPIGIGVILFRADLSLFLSSLKSHPPVAVWFFAPETAEQLDTWIINTKSHYPEIKIFVQLGSVKELKALLAGPAGEGIDVIVAQGVADSGGHGLCRGASVVGLVPEFRNVIRESGRVIPVLAAGGIVDGCGAAAALALGASGVVMGTRFILTPECAAADGFKEYLLNLSDGGQNTTRTRIFDTLRGTGFWPQQYNGRGAMNGTLRDDESGMAESENRELYEKALASGDWERLTMFCGTGVGSIQDLQPAGEVVVSVRDGAVKALREAAQEFAGL
ncbi:uncharacterized protein LAJ45_08576 [Morchella importuna]|uniref:uncharacterized protein n=1 Tax=Morchella importuna TaxID=1174673 RepID=UPI001E8CBE5F|nr:uncharacterized protein LAJ45_08576 [Morchella importuna]KAH8147420.1 hypothetical protein LAJ45_08576 [Morchella importuna]